MSLAAVSLVGAFETCAKSALSPGGPHSATKDTEQDETHDDRFVEQHGNNSSWLPNVSAWRAMGTSNCRR